MVLKQTRDTAGAAAEVEKAGALNRAMANLQAATQATDAGAKKLRQGDVEGSTEQFRAVLQRAPNFAPAHYQLGLALRERRNREQASPEFEKAYQLDRGMKLLRQ